MNTKILIFLFSLLAISYSCSSDIDTEKPLIDLSISEAFPLNCDTLYFGESFTLKVLFTDNVELGSFSIDIHNNFDHHSHSTEVSECELAPIKDPINPYVVIIDNYEIPSGMSTYETNISIPIPANDGENNYDEGDYHFFISLTDHEGWSAQKGISIKMMYR